MKWVKENLRRTLTIASLIYKKYIFFVLKFHFYLFPLFLMYANGMSQAIQSKPFLFRDDSTLAF